MGCEWKLVTDERGINRERLRDEVEGILEHWEQVLSTWRPNSDLSRYNRGEPASDDLRRVLDLAEKLHRETGGAFDHRMLAQLAKAGFGPGGTGADLSSVGKGFAVDRVCEFLQERGIRRHVFSLAGEVRAGEGEWPCRIESPTAEETNPPFPLSHGAMATSGNYRQWKAVKEGRLVSHILDPDTGEPVLRPPCSVTVFGPDAAEASGWATALFVLGPRGNALAEKSGLKVIWKGTPLTVRN
jgi:thiamine biosynthesis lipoprotein